MGGVYVHVPFCRSKCYYCGFYSVASPVLRSAYVDALCREIDLRQSYLKPENMESLYFGGGTPSYLTEEELGSIVRKLEKTYQFLPAAEKTIEVNPEDLEQMQILTWKSLGFNRLSIGVQTFNEEVLKRINRTHSAGQAIEGIKRAAEAGFSNISVDLIIGLPGSCPEDLAADLKIIAGLPVSHVSVYMLSIEQNSVFEKQIRKGVFVPVTDEVLAERYRLASGILSTMGFEHYEISNFALKGKYAIHNSNYWKNKPYVGLGPSAHSYDLVSRQWNISHLKSYIESLDNFTLNFEREVLSDINRYNEYLMTGLRTMWGIDLDFLRQHYPHYWALSEKTVGGYLKEGILRIDANRLYLTEPGWLVSDTVFCDLFQVES